MAFNYWGETDAGKVRKKNEDAFEGFILNNTLFLIVADGFGIVDDTNEQTAGIVAANEAKRFLEKFYAKPDSDNLQLIMWQCIYAVNRIVCSYKKANFDNYSGFGASFTMIAILPNKKTVMCHMGNTRLYILRDGQLLQCTKDHTEAQKLLDTGSITQEEYINHPERVILTNGLGYNEDLNIDIFKGRLNQNDFVLLLTDGVYNSITKDAIVSIVLESGDLETATKMFIQVSKDLGGYDNGTVVISYINF